MVTKKQGIIKVAVVLSSPIIKDLLATILQNDRDIHVIGNGLRHKDAIELVKSRHPDILLLEYRSPDISGLEVIRRVMREAPLPIILIYDNLTTDEKELTFTALQAGAIAALKVPDKNDTEEHSNFLRIVRNVVGVPVIHHWGHSQADRVNNASNLHAPSAHTEETIQSIARNISDIETIGIAASTGGPGALTRILTGLPKTFPVPVLIVQHISNGFEIGFSEWLKKQVQLDVTVVSRQEALRPGTIYLAPEDCHLEIPVRGMVTLSKDSPYKGLRPSANQLFHSLAKTYESSCLGVILTGMGDDGLHGLMTLHQSGGFVIAQDEASCAVFGMPKEAIRNNVVNEVLSLEQIALVLKKFAMMKNSPK